MIEVVTDHPVAVDSLDHVFPLGAIEDNTPDCGFIDEIERHFGRKPLAFLDIGCAGGQFVVDAITRGHKAVGLEGSDKPRAERHANWPEYDGTALFTCDVRYPFEARENGIRLQFDCITAWDVLEHFTESELPRVFDNVLANLAPGGIFCGKVYIGGAGRTKFVTTEGLIMEVDHHRLRKDVEWWSATFQHQFQSVTPCPVNNWLRPGGLLFCLRKRGA